MYTNPEWTPVTTELNDPKWPNTEANVPLSNLMAYTHIHDALIEEEE